MRKEVLVRSCLSQRERERERERGGGKMQERNHCFSVEVLLCVCILNAY